MKDLSKKEGHLTIQRLLRLSILLIIGLVSASAPVWAQSSGTLQMTVQNQMGTPRSEALCMLYNSRYESLGTTFNRTTNGSGVATWTGLPAGTYNIEAYYDGASPFAGFPGEFWASKQISHSFAQTPTKATVRRDRPFATSFVIKNNATGQTLNPATPVPAGTTVRAEIIVLNPSGYAQSARVRLILDKSRTSPYTYDETASPKSVSGNNGNTTFTFTSVATGDGIFGRALKVETHVNNKFVKTDSWAWNDAFAVEPNQPPPAITTSNLPNGTVGVAYDETLKTIGGDGTNYTWKLVDGTLPNGLTLSSKGKLSGTPTRGQTSVFTVKVTSDTQTATRTLSMTVVPAPFSTIAISVNPESADFGFVSVGSSSIVEFEIENSEDSVDPLIVTVQGVTGSDSDFAIIDGGGPFTLNPGESHLTRIRFLPSLPGEKEAMLTISSNATDASSMTLPLSGTGIGPTAIIEQDRTGGMPPGAFLLEANKPNPFNPSTQIAYEVPRQAHITLTVYNLLGQEVVRLVDQAQAAGRYSVTWNARNSRGHALSSGVYLYRITSSSGYAESRRMTLLK